MLSSSGTLGDDKRQITAGNPNEIWTFSRLKNNDKKYIDNNIDSTFFKNFSYKNFFDKSKVLKVKHEKFESYRDKEEISLHRLRNAINKIFKEQDKKYIKRKNILKENCNILYDKNIKKVSNKNYNKDLANCKSYDNFKFSNKNFSLETKEKNSIKALDKISENLSYKNLKEIFKKINIENDYKNQEIKRLKVKISQIKASNETLVLNLKQQYKEVLLDNNKAREEYEKIKKTIKFTRYNEIMKEKEIFENEMKRMKEKLSLSMEIIEKYKKCIEENKIMKEELTRKSNKINNLENEIISISSKSEKIMRELETEIYKRDKKILKLENELKKYVLIYQMQKLEDQKNMLNKNLIIHNCHNHKQKTEKNENSDLIFKSPNYPKIRENLMSASWKSMNLRMDKDKNKQNNTLVSQNNDKFNIDEGKELILTNKRIFEIIKEYPELYQLYIEMKVKKIKNEKIFIKEVLSNLKNENNIKDNKIIYQKAIIKLLNIEDTNGKQVIEKLSQKEFRAQMSLDEIKKHHIEILTELFNNKRNEKDRKLFQLKLREMNLNELKYAIGKYDKIESGYLFFNQMMDIIMECKLEEFIEEILLITKEQDIFNLMNYNYLLNKIKKVQSESNSIDGIKRVKKMYKESFTENKNDLDYNFDKKESYFESTKKCDESDKIENIKDERIIKEYERTNKTNKPILDVRENEEYEKEFISTNKVNKIISETKNVNDNQQRENVNEIWKKLAHKIKLEGSTPSVYIDSLKEVINGKEQNMNVINSEKLFKFLENQEILINDEEKKELINQLKIKVDNNSSSFFDFDKVIEKIFEFIKNDRENTNDSDFMKNIKRIEIEGVD